MSIDKLLKECERCGKQSVLWRGVCHSCSKKIRVVNAK